jgi:hemoglobin
MASVYEEIGGAAAVAAAVDGLYERILGDPVLGGWFTGVEMGRQKRHMRAFMATALGGAEVYAGRDMGAAHAGLRITDEAFDRVVGHLVDTLTSLGVPADTIAAIGAKLAPLRAQVVEVPAAVA